MSKLKNSVSYPALALAFNPPEEAELPTKPRRRRLLVERGPMVPRLIKAHTFTPNDILNR